VHFVFKKRMKADVKKMMPVVFIAGLFLVPAVISVPRAATKVRRLFFVEPIEDMQMVNRWDRLPSLTGFIWTAGSPSTDLASFLVRALPFPNHTPPPSDRAEARVNVAVLAPTLDRMNRPALRAHTRTEPRVRRSRQLLSKRPSIVNKKILE
jgi:hypothetical protein